MRGDRFRAELARRLRAGEADETFRVRLRAARADLADWRTEAACRGHDSSLWFADATYEQGRSELAKAKAICARCPVSVECLEHALEQGETGVWGAKTEQERTRLRNRRTA